MEGNDIASFARRRLGVVFEGLIATPPEGLRSFTTRVRAVLRRNDPVPDYAVEAWDFDPIIYRSLRAFTLKGYDAALEVYTFQSAAFAIALDGYLRQRGVDVSATLMFKGPFDLAQYLRGNLDVIEVLTVDTDWASMLGPRARVVRPGTPLGF